MSLVLIFRSRLLPISETFIQAQAGALRRYQPRFAGLLSTEPSLPIPADRLLLSPWRGRAASLHARWYRATGRAQGFHARAAACLPLLVHAHFALDGAEALPLAEALGVPLVVTLHGFDVTRADRFHQTAEARHYLRRRELLWQRAARFLCVSEFIRERALAGGFPAGKLQVHAIGIDRARFRFGEERPASQTVLYVGRLVEKKGLPHLIRAMAQVQRRHPGARLVVIGAGPLDSHCRRLAAECNVCCEFLGAQPAEAVRRMLAQAAMFCLPSVTAQDGDTEGLPIALLEAMAAGVPVLASRHAGIPEAVEHERSGLLADEGDVDGLAAGVCRFLEEPALAERCRRAAAIAVAERFDLAQQTAVLEGIYDGVLGRHAGGCSLAGDPAGKGFFRPQTKVPAPVLQC